MTEYDWMLIGWSSMRFSILVSRYHNWYKNKSFWMWYLSYSISPSPNPFLLYQVISLGLSLYSPLHLTSPSQPYLIFMFPSLIPYLIFRVRRIYWFDIGLLFTLKIKNNKSIIKVYNGISWYRNSNISLTTLPSFTGFSGLNINAWCSLSIISHWTITRPFWMKAAPWQCNYKGKHQNNHIRVICIGKTKYVC